MSAELTSKRLLVVEDDFFILSELEHTLLEAGAQVTGARSVDEALSRLNGSQFFSGAILDFRLGRDNAARIASALSERGIPFVFYTGQTATELAQTEWCHVQVIPKPSSSRTILSAVRRWFS